MRRSPDAYKGTIYDILIESLLIIVLIFTPLAYGAVGSWSIAILEITAALMAVLLIFKSESIRSLPIYIIVFLILYASLHLFVISIYPWATKTELLKIIAYAIIFFVTLNTIKAKLQITRVLLAIIIMGFLMSILSLMRHFGVKIPGGFVNPDHFSAYLGMIIPLSLGFLLVPSFNTEQQHTNDERRPMIAGHRPLLFFFALVMSTALFFTMSRGGMFSFIAALLFIASLVSTRRSIKNKGWIILAIAVFIILIIAWLGATPIVERILSVKAEIASRYFGGRLPIWQGTIGIINDNFIFGTGLGTFNYIFPKYQPLEIINKHYTYAHSDVLELLSETGIIGFSLAVICGLWSVVYLFRRFNERHDPWVVGMSLCAFGSLTAIFLHSFTDFNLHIPANAVLLAVILALFVSILKAEKRWPGIASGGRIMGYPVAVLAAGLLVVYMVAVIRPAIGLDPSNAEYHYKLGRLYGKSGKYDLQLAEYQEAVRLNPTNSQYHQSLAWAYGLKSEYMDLAHNEFQKAIQYEPNFYYCYYIYANWLLNYPRNENIGKGFELYKKAIQLNPQLTKEVLTKYGHDHNDYEKLVDILPGIKASDAECFKFINKKMGLKYAISFAERFLKTYSQNAEIHFWIAHDSFYDGSYPWDFTERHYSIAFDNDSRNGFYRLYHGVHLFFKGQYGNALKDLEMSLTMTLYPNDAEKAIEYIAKCKDALSKRT